MYYDDTWTLWGFMTGMGFVGLRWQRWADDGSMEFGFSWRPLSHGFPKYPPLCYEPLYQVRPQLALKKLNKGASFVWDIVYRGQLGSPCCSC